MIEPIGLAAIALGIVCYSLDRHAIAVSLIVVSVLGSAAAVNAGGASIQPAYLLLGFCALATFSRQGEGYAALRSVRPGTPGFWLACLVTYGVVTSFFLPRIFAGATAIIPLGTSEFADTGSTVPLGPVSSNLTQSVYMIANLVCFMTIASVASQPRGFQAVMAGLLGVCAANVALAALDVATYATGTQSVLGFVRNARYTFHHEEEVFGLKRIVGTFPEASAFARFTLGTLGFSGTLVLCGYRQRLTGTLALASLALVVFSTSSSGLAALAPLCILFYATAVLRCGVRRSACPSSLLVLFVPQILVAAVLFALVDPKVFAVVHSYVDTLVLTKSSGSSGIERSSWNTYAWQNVLDTGGVGVGLGTARTSSYAHALLAGVGVVGTLFYALFLGGMLLDRRGSPRTLLSDIRLACCNGCLGLLMADMLVAPTIDQGIFFYSLAALACAEPEPAGAADTGVAGLLASSRTMA